MIIIKIKICGITNLDDAIAAVDMGADILGFNFYEESPRYITPEKAEKIINQLPAFIDNAGVFVNAKLEQIYKITSQCQLNWVQLHGNENPQFCDLLRSLNVKTMKAIRVKDQEDIKASEKFFTDAVLLDAFDPSKYGGTGLTFDWNIIGNIEKRIFLAGGINPDNIEGAMELGIYGVDVCSGIEESPGKKDHEKMKKLFEKVREIRG